MDEPRAWIAQRAKKLRKTQTSQELKLWISFRDRRFSNFKFRRQVPIGHYIVDFVCFERKLMVELDGSQHLDQKLYDESRDDFLRGQGFRVLRFWNHEVDLKYQEILERIFLELNV